MLHLDEGTLHEYLDRGGSDDFVHSIETHLSQCATCRRRLEDVEQDRAGAAQILRAAAPAGIPRPKFESLLPRPEFETFDNPRLAEAKFAEPTAQFRLATIGMRGQAVVFAWAATLVLAVAMGWFASSMYREQQAAANNRAAALPDTIRPLPSESGDSIAAPPPAPPQPSLEQRVSMEPAPIPDQSNTRDPRIVSEISPSAMGPVGSAPPVTSVPPSPGVLMKPGQTREGGPADADHALRQTQLSTALHLQPYPDSLTAVLVGTAATWNPVDAADAMRILGGKMVRAKGLRVLDYAMRADSGVLRVRVRQRFTNGDTIEIYQTQPAAAPVNGKKPGRNAPMFRSVAGGTYFSRFYATMLWNDARTVTVIASKASAINAWKPYLTSATRD